MYKRLLIFLSVLFIYLSWVHPALAQTTYAVVVGISDYALFGPGNGDLNFADNDARLFTALLQSKEGGQVPAHNIILLTDRNATRTNILRALTLFERATDRDRVIFYFSGHGDQTYLVPYDARPGLVLFHDDVKRAFRKSAAQTKFLLADACKSGNIRRHTYTVAPARRPSENNKNVIVMMSSRANQLSQELGQLQHGAFTYFLVRGAAGEADMDRNRVVTMKELYQYMHSKIMRVTHEKQTPVVVGRFPVSLAFSQIGN